MEPDEDRCAHGTPEDLLCAKCEANPECNWNEGGDSMCACEP